MYFFRECQIKNGLLKVWQFKRYLYNLYRDRNMQKLRLKKHRNKKLRNKTDNFSCADCSIINICFFLDASFGKYHWKGNIISSIPFHIWKVKDRLFLLSLRIFLKEWQFFLKLLNWPFSLISYSITECFSFFNGLFFLIKLN